MTIYESEYPDAQIPDVSVTDFILRHSKRLADKVAIIDGPTGRTVTYAQLEGRIRALAGGLQARGVGPGTTIALMSPNLPEFAIVFHAVALAGATVTTLNPTYGAEELAFQLKDAGASWIVTIGMFAEVAAKAADEAGVDHRVIIGDAPEGWEGLAGLFGAPLAEQVSVDPAEDLFSYAMV